MVSLAREYGIWFAKCLVLGSIPGGMCWALWFYFDGFATFA